MFNLPQSKNYFKEIVKKIILNAQKKISPLDRTNNHKIHIETKAWIVALEFKCHGAKSNKVTKSNANI